jgi:FMN hydrolase / 5-amino-6-(5-phospho-D-ribitylamino)uracil phosphatase
MPIAAISFDLDDTLWDIGPVILNAEHAMYDYLREMYPRVTDRYSLEEMRDIRAKLALDRPDMRHDFTWLRRESLRMHASAAGYPPSMAEDVFEVFFVARNAVTLYEDVVPTLQSLTQAGLRLFVITNGNADLGRIGIAGYFERIVHARNAGALKPAEAIFRHLLGSVGLEPRSVLHVGDDPLSDIAGARRVGMRTAWINRNQAPWPDDHTEPDFEIVGLSELTRALSKR